MASQALASLAERLPSCTRSPELEDEILLRMANGESYSSIYRSDRAKFPHPVTWSDWTAADPALSLARAVIKDHQADALVQDAMDIIDTEPNLVATKDGTRYDGAHVVILKHRSDLRMKRAAQINPAVYGDKTLHAGHDGKEIKTEVAMSITQTLAQLREAKRLGQDPSSAIVEARRPEPSDRALLAKADQRTSNPPAAPRGPEPGDPGMEFV